MGDDTRERFAGPAWDTLEAWVREQARHMVQQALEKEETRLTVEAANKFAGAIELTLSEFLGELSGRITGLRGVKTAGGRATTWMS